MKRELLDDLDRLLRPLKTKIANLIVRGVVQVAYDTAKLQRLQLGALADETVDDAEHHQPYGFASVPLAGAEHITIFPGGDRGHPITIAVSDRRHRPTGAQPGEVTVYNDKGAKVVLTKDGDVKVTAAPGRKVLVDDGSGATALPTMSDFAALITILGNVGAGPATAVPATLSAYQSSHPTWPVGTSVLRGK